jgi:hypothetical protein
MTFHHFSTVFDLVYFAQFKNSYSFSPFPCAWTKPRAWWGYQGAVAKGLESWVASLGWKPKACNLLALPASVTLSPHFLFLPPFPSIFQNTSTRPDFPSPSRPDQIQAKVLSTSPDSPTCCKSAAMDGEGAWGSARGRACNLAAGGTVCPRGAPAAAWAPSPHPYSNGRLSQRSFLSIPKRFAVSTNLIRLRNEPYQVLTTVSPQHPEHFQILTF